MFRLAIFAASLLAISAGSILAQAPAAPQPGAAPSRPPRPPAPTRDPHTPGYVTAKELPDGTMLPQTSTATSSSAPHTIRRPKCRCRRGCRREPCTA